MKVLWVEDNHNACNLLNAAGDAATRERLDVDLVMATSLLDAERKLRLERFDLVVVDLRLPDSIDEDATLTRISNMGDFRVAVVSASDRRQDVVDTLVGAGQNCAETAIAKEELNLANFVAHPSKFHDFLEGLLQDRRTTV